MTVNGICHALWDDGHTHLCGRPADHPPSWHLCTCGALLLQGGGAVPDEVRRHRAVDCPDCLARAGRPCVHRRQHGSDVVMPGVHATRAALAKRTAAAAPAPSTNAGP